MSLQMYEDQIITLGSRVHIRDIESGERDVYSLTRPNDADIRENRISTMSPIGRALYGERPGRVVEVQAPGGMFLVEIEAVDQESDSRHARDG